MSINTKRRWHQFSLKTMVVVMTLACVAAGWLAYERNEVRKRATIIAVIEKLGGTVDYDESQPFRPRWLRPLLGDKSPGEVAQVFLVGEVTDAELIQVAGLTELKRLCVTSDKITDSGLSHLAGLGKLQKLSLDKAKVTDSGLEHLMGLQKLEDLSLNNTQVSDAGLARIAGLGNLQYLSLGGTKVTDAGLSHFASLVELRRVDVDDTQITDTGLVHLAHLKELTHLNLGGTRVTDAGLVRLADLPNLELCGSLAPTSPTRAWSTLPDCGNFNGWTWRRCKLPMRDSPISEPFQNLARWSLPAPRLPTPGLSRSPV